ncbi:hypothetical protein AXFE_04350 [Acidithrix ferrooxidans]|uniref:Uncharacterized protein n=1 Tax=Acidithrix ferrooxidans TaxID=1280514 RepID=A0A0D8HLC4_9ACTN|nr:hypothetical protein AXFE_04350 [Acidithrix ferrooxidans]
MISPDPSLGSVNGFFDYGYILISSLGAPLVITLSDKLPGTSRLNKLLNSVWRTANVLSCSVIRSKKIVSLDDIHGFFAILHFRALSRLIGCCSNPIMPQTRASILLFSLKVIARRPWCQQLLDRLDLKAVDHAMRSSRMQFSWP